MSIPFIKASCESFQDIEKLIYLDSLLNASLLNHVTQRASKQQVLYQKKKKNLILCNVLNKMNYYLKFHIFLKLITFSL